MKRTNTVADVLNTGKAQIDVGDGIIVPFPTDGIFTGEPGPAGAGVPVGGSALQVIRKDAAGTATEWATLSKADFGLGNVSNTSDADKPLSTEQIAALAGKEPSITGGTVGQFYRGDKTWVTPTKADVGLSNVDNTADAEKPISTPQATALGLKADKDEAAILAAAPTGGDDTASLNAKLTAGAGKTVRLRPGASYAVAGSLVVPSGTTLDLNGALLDFTTMQTATAQGQRKAITVTGSLGAPLPVSTAVTQWSRTVAGISSTAGLVAGDLVLMTNDERPVPGLTRTDRDKGELNVIQSVDSATQVTLTTGAVFAYGTTGLQLQKVSPAENVLIRGGRIKMAGIGSGHNGIEIQYARNCTVRDVTIDGAEDVAVNFRTVYNGKAINNTISNSTSNAGLGNTGYGVSIVEGSRHVLVQGNQFYNCRHFVAGGGYWPPVFVDVKDNHGERSSDAGYDCHESCFYWTFEGNTAAGVASGFIIRGQYITIDGNHVADSLGRAYRASTFDGVTEQRGIRIINNRGNRSTYGIEIDGQAAGAEPNCLKIDIKIAGNSMRDCGPNPILLRHFDGAKVSDNEIFGSTGHAILILGLSGTQSKTLALNTNTVKDAALDGCKVQYVDDVSINGGQILNSGNSGVELLNCNRTDTNGLKVKGTAFSGIYISAGATHSLTGVHASGGTGATYDALRVSGSSNLTVNGGYYASLRNAVYSTTTEYVIVQGVNGRDAASGTKINVDAVTKSVANNLV